MRDALTNHEHPGDDHLVRDLLPALLHGRLAGAERARAEAHVAECAECAAELALLGDTRSALVAAGPAVDVAAIAAAVREATVPHGAPAGERPGGGPPARSQRGPRSARASRWRGARAWRAVAATVLLAVGSGAVYFGSHAGDGQLATTGTAPRTAPVVGGPLSAGAASSAGAAAAAPNASALWSTGAPLLASAEPALGAGFDDLSDEELQAVLDAVTGDGATLPAAEPEGPAMEVEGGR